MVAADAQKGHGASLHALLTLRPPMWTGNVAWFHCELRSTFKIFVIIIIINIIIIIIIITIIFFTASQHEACRLKIKLNCFAD